VEQWIPELVKIWNSQNKIYYRVKDA